jgi:hypothetical protein
LGEETYEGDKRMKIDRTLLLVTIILLTQIMAGSIFAMPMDQKQEEGSNVKDQRYKDALATFDEQIKAYVKKREQLEETLPKLSKESSPEEIKAHQVAFAKLVRESRVGAKSGDIFRPAIVDYIRTSIRREFKGERLKEIREAVLEADTKGVPLRINHPYPETKELVETPPTLLLTLPQLPKQLRYRFVGKHMLLVDRENGLIIDYMVNALP